MRQLLSALHRLFDPRPQGGAAESFSLKRPEPKADPHPDLTVHTRIEAPAQTALREIRVRAAGAEARVRRTLEQIQGDLSADFDLNLALLKDGMHYGRTSDVVVREFTLPFAPPVRAALLYLDGVIASTDIELTLVGPLLTLPRGRPRPAGPELLDELERSLLPGRHLQRVFTHSQALGALTGGLCALLLESAPGILLIEARQWPGRSIEKPLAETTLRGPQEAFTENLRTNTALVRKRLMTPDLIFEPAEVGRRSRTRLCIGYLNGIANPALIAEIRRRIAHLDIDVLHDTGTLEQLIEDSPLKLLPTLAHTARPDRVVAALAEGRAALLVDGSPDVLIAPTVFGDFMRTAEDYYVRWPFATFLRLIRTLGLVTTLLLPALYIAIANYHPEMIPTALLLAIAASREAVPLPAALEVLLMELAFEIIREGSVRTPTVLAQTVGIVGALILGQAAVQASIVSPLLVIVVATTALGSFNIPVYSMNLAIRVLRFGFILLAAAFGLYGIAAGLFLLAMHATALRSFGVPYLAPLGARQPANPDGLMGRDPLFQLDRRPALARPLDPTAQTERIRDWFPQTPNKGGDSDE